MEVKSLITTILSLTAVLYATLTHLTYFSFKCSGLIIVYIGAFYVSISIPPFNRHTFIYKKAEKGTYTKV